MTFPKPLKFMRAPLSMKVILTGQEIRLLTAYRPSNRIGKGTVVVHNQVRPMRQLGLWGRGCGLVKPMTRPSSRATAVGLLNWELITGLSQSQC